jgi:hypothetical protein
MNENTPQTNYDYQLPTSTLAIISLISGIVGFTIFPIVASIVALVTGYAARKETRAIPPQVSGDGLATAGIIMGWVQVGLGVIGLCLAAAFFIFGLSLIGLSAGQQ